MASYISVLGKCSQNKKDLLVQIEKQRNGDVYVAQGSCYASSDSAGEKTDAYSGKLVPGPRFKCRYCGNTCIICCGQCGTISCLKEGAPTHTCPTCGRETEIEWVDNIDDLSDSSLTGNGQ